MYLPDLESMLETQDQPCLSLIIPTVNYTHGRTLNPEIIQKALSKAEKLLANTAWPSEQIAQLVSKVESLKNKIDYMRLQQGLAIFISPDIFRIYLLPFSVVEKIILARTFEIRDILYFNQFLETYYLLAVSKKLVRLFKGRGRDLQELVNDDFPRKYVEEYEYSLPSPGRVAGQGVKSFERDKSVLQEKRMKTFFHHADVTLDKYLKKGMRLFVAGVDEELAGFEMVSHHTKHIAGKIKGNYDVDAAHPLAEVAWKLILEEVGNHHAKLISQLQEDRGRNLTAGGIVEVWRCAYEGKGLTVLLEKDYRVRGYLHTENRGRLHVEPPAGKYEIIQDAANDVLEVVKEKGGNIVIVENGLLREFGHIAMLLRY